MKSFTTAIIIKVFGIVVAAFIIATSTLLYFEYKYHFFTVIGIMIGVCIFILSMKYEPEFEPESDDKNGNGVKL